MRRFLRHATEPQSGSRRKVYTLPADRVPAMFTDTDPDAWWSEVRATIDAAYERVRSGISPAAGDPTSAPDSATACAAAAAIVLAESQGLRGDEPPLRIGGGPW